MITGEMYDNHDLHWSARQKSIGVHPRLPLLTTHSKLFTNSRTIMGMEDSQQERHYAAPNCWHHGSGHKKLPYPVIHLFGESRTTDVRWVSMQMHLSLIHAQPWPRHRRDLPQLSLAALWAGLEARKV
jgi:hypothetical protein